MAVMFPGAGCASRNDSASSPQVIDGSLRFLQGLQNQNFANYLKRTLSADGNRQTYTFSVWCTRKQLKGMQLGNGYDASTFDLAGTNDFRIEFESSRADALNIFDDGMANNMDVTTNAVYRDTNAWYHIVAAVDTTQGTAADRVKLYVNGVHQTSLATATYPTEDTQGEWNDASYTHYLGQRGTGSLWDGSLAQYYFLDGQALAASDFGYTDQLTNTWRPKKFTGSYGTPGGSAAGGTLPNYNSNAALPTYSNQGGGSSPGGSTSVSDAFDDSGNYCDMTYLNGQWSKLTFDENITNVTNITIGYDGEGDPGYNGGNVQTSVSFNGSRQTIQIYSGGTITLENLYFISQPGSGVCRLYDVTITTSGASATELTFTPPTHNNSFYLPLDGSAPIGQDQSPCENDWTPVNFGGSASLDKATGALPILNTVSGGGVASSGVRKDYRPTTPSAVVKSGCVAFDGSSDALSLANSSDFSFGSGNFTVEGWVYCKGATTGTSQVIASFYDTGDNKRSWQLTRHGSGNNIRFYYSTDGSTGLNVADTSNTRQNQWQHIAAVRNSDTLTLYINGVSVATATVSGSLYDNTSDILVIGASDAGGTTSKFLAGIISNLRIVKGTAVYTSNFTPSGEPLTNITNTKLLCCQSSTDSTEAAVKPGSLTKIGTPIATASESSAYLVLALPLVGTAIDVSNQINSGSTTKAVTTNGDPTASSVQSNFYGGSFDFDATGDYFNTTTSSTDFSFGTGDFTIEAWCYPDSGADNKGMWQLSTTSGGLVAASTTLSANYESDEFYFGSAGGWRNSGKTHADDKWHHVAEVRNGGTIYIYVDGVLDQSWSDTSTYDMTYWAVGGYYTTSYLWSGFMQDFRVYKGVAKYTGNFIPASTNPDIQPISPSGAAYSSELTKPSAGAVGFNDSASSFLQLDTSDDYEFGTGDFSIECWFMLDQLGEQQHLYEGRKSGNAGRVLIYVKTDNKVYFYGDAADRISSRLLSKHIWYHVAVCRVSGTSTLYLDGVSQGTYSDSNDYDKPASYLYIGIDDSPSGSNMGGYISNMRVLKGSAAYSSAFRPSTAPLTNITNTKLLCCQSPIDPTAAAVIATGSITANGFCASPINFNPFDSDIGVVEGRPTGYCTWNPLVRSSAGRGTYKSNNVIFQGTDAWKSTTGTLAVSSGKWYYEQKAYGNMYGTATGNLAMGFGWSKVNEVITDEDFYNNSTQRARATAFFNTGGYNNFSTYVGTVCTPATGDIMATALDKDNNTIKYYLNGVEVVSATLGNTTSELTPFCQCYYDDSYFEANFGQTPFRYTPPEGYQPLCKANLPRPEDAVRPDKVVKVQIWDGNDAQRNIHTYGFQPDLVWFKSRTSTNGQMWIDSVRGAEKCMYAHQNAAEETQAQSLVSFDREGFRMGTFANNNASGESYVAYAWKAGGNTGTFNVDGKDVGSAAAAGLTGGNYTPKACSINTTHGFAILTWDGDLTGAGTKSIAHGLSGFVDAGWMIISKRYSGGTSDWWVQHYSIADNSNVLKLNEYDPKTDISGDGAITTPTDTLFYGNWNSGLAANSNIIGYLWKDVPRIQKFGSYTGNSSADGPYVELGFRPAMLMIKRSASSNANWYMMDIETQSFNAVTEALEPNTHDAMNTSVVNFDFLSNGFKLRGTDGDINSSGVLYIYAAWAHQPEQNLYGAPALAR